VCNNLFSSAGCWRRFRLALRYRRCAPYDSPLLPCIAGVAVSTVFSSLLFEVLELDWTGLSACLAVLSLLNLSVRWLAGWAWCLVLGYGASLLRLLGSEWRVSAVMIFLGGDLIIRKIVGIVHW